MSRINKAYGEGGVQGGETLHETAGVLKSKNCLVLMWLHLLKGIFSGLRLLPKEKLLPVGETSVKTMLGENQNNLIDFN